MRIVPVSGKALPPEAEKEYAGAPVFDRLRVGCTGVFYPSGLRTRYLPYDAFERAYVMVHETKARMCCATTDYEYYRIVFMHEDKCVADCMSEDKEAMKAALEQLRKSAPGIRIGAE